MKTQTAVMIVGADLGRDSSGNVIAGDETKTACLEALLFATSSTNRFLIATAGEAGREWDKEWMALVMKNYILSLDNLVRIHVEKAKVFTTNGEMKSLAYHIWVRDDVKEVVLVVKWWHAPRAEFLCRYWFERYAIRDVKITVKRCHSKVGKMAIFKEYIGAWPKNLFLMLFNKL